MTQARKPSIGRIVHYWCELTPGDGFQPSAAIVTAVRDDRVSLQVFPERSRAFFVRNVPHETVATLGGVYWEWPPLV